MNHVFISYCSEDKSYADAIKGILDKDGLHTWIAPDSIPAGAVYAEEIVKAIKSAGAVVLILSANALRSIWVEREIERAVHYRKQIFPIQIDDAPLTASIELMISATQIIPYNRLIRNKTVENNFLISVRKAVYNITDEPVPPSKPKSTPPSAKSSDSVSGSVSASSGRQQNTPAAKPQPSPAKATGSGKSKFGLFVLRLIIFVAVITAISGLINHTRNSSNTSSTTTTTQSSFSLDASNDYEDKSLEINRFLIRFPLSYENAKRWFGIEDYYNTHADTDYIGYDYETDLGFPMRFYIYGTPPQDQTDYSFSGIAVSDTNAVVCGVSPGMQLFEAKKQFGYDYTVGETTDGSGCIYYTFQHFNNKPYRIFVYYDSTNIITAIACFAA